MNDQQASQNSNEWKIVVIICLMAALHVFIFSATFPFFNDVDEQAHIDLAIRYSQYDIPRKLDLYCAEARPFLVVYYSPEYLNPAGSEPTYPAWKQPMKDAHKGLMELEAYYKTNKNPEASQPPLYYVLAGIWWQFGKLLKMDGLILLYWLRFLNVMLIVALVCLGWIATRKIFPDNKFIRLSVPMLIAFMPQTTFYSVNSDILSPLVFGAVFFLMLEFIEVSTPSLLLAATTGLALAATYLTKISNLPLLAAAGIFLGFKVFKLAKNESLRAAFPALGILAACAVLPAVMWMTWCQLVFGDPFGSGPKIQMLGWTNKSFAEWFHHPIFSCHGFWTFFSGNVSTFWQGEFLWHRRPLAIPSVDLFYVVLTFAVMLAAIASLPKASAKLMPAQRVAIQFACACSVLAFGFFALLSVKYDFHDCFYPSREHPYFTSGRLMLGFLIPFLVLFSYGLDRLLVKFTPVGKFAMLAVLMAFMLASEITVDWSIFPDEFNWFHM